MTVPHWPTSLMALKSPRAMPGLQTICELKPPWQVFTSSLMTSSCALHELAAAYPKYVSPLCVVHSRRPYRGVVVAVVDCEEVSLVVPLVV